MLNKFSYIFDGKNLVDIVDKNIMSLDPFCVPIISQKEKFNYGQFIPIIYIHEIIHSSIENNN